jgi:hypothetical protein
VSSAALSLSIEFQLTECRAYTYQGEFTEGWEKEGSQINDGLSALPDLGFSSLSYRWNKKRFPAGQ